MTKEFQSTCPSCAKPITTENGLVPHHEIGFNRGGKVVKQKCPGVGRKPN